MGFLDRLREYDKNALADKDALLKKVRAVTKRPQFDIEEIGKKSINNGQRWHFVAITPLSMLKGSLDRPYIIHSLIVNGVSKVYDKEYVYLNGIPS